MLIKKKKKILMGKKILKHYQKDKGWVYQNSNLENWRRN